MSSYDCAKQLYPKLPPQKNHMTMKGVLKDDVQLKHSAVSHDTT